MTTYAPESPQEETIPLEEPGEPEPTPEPEPEPDEADVPLEEPPEPPSEPETQARMEEIGKALDKLQKHVAKRLGEILGDDAPFYVPCELCTPFQTPGMRPPIDPPPDVAAALWHLLGQHSPTDYQADTHSTVCSRCAGFGEVATGSKVPGQTQLPCVECKGLGWTPTDDARAPGFGTVANGPTPLYPPPSPDVSALPAPDEPDPPEVTALKAKGYTIIRPFVPAG